jgi:hypothetical protein
MALATMNLEASQKQMKRLTISMSQVAPLIGLDNYGNFPRIVCEIWRRLNPVEFREFELRLKAAGATTLANSNEMNDIWEVDDQLGTNILEKVRELNSNTSKTSADMTKAQAVVAEYINQQSGLTEDKKAEIVKKVCSITNKSHGVSNEDAILAEFCNLSGKTLQGTQGWVEIPLVSSTQHSHPHPPRMMVGDIEIEWVVVGKYDGITTDGELVEAKMRQKGLFKTIRDYENVQVQLYLHALRYQSAFLVEGFSKAKTSNTTKKDKKKNELQTEPQTESKTVQKPELVLCTHEVAYDASYVIEIILARLQAFTKYFHQLMLDTTRKEKILKSDPSEWSEYLEEYLDIPQLEF